MAPIVRALVAGALGALLLAPAVEAGACKCAWRPASDGLPPQAYVLSLAIHPKTGVVYAGTIWRGIHKSRDGGRTWTSTNRGLPLLGEGIVRLPADIPALVAHPTRPGTVYAATSFSGIMKTVDGGATWRLTNDGVRAAHPGTFNSPPLFTRTSALVIDPRRPQTLYAAMHGVGVLRSSNGGASWKAVSSGLTDPNLEALALAPAPPGTLYAGTLGGGVFKTRDGGASWRAVNDGLVNRLVTALVVDGRTRGSLYAGTFGGGVFRSIDGGAHWRAANNGLRSKLVHALVLDPAHPGALYAGTLGGVFETVDGGRHWRPLNRGLANTLVHALTLDPTGSGTLYAGTLGSGVFVLEVGR